MKFGLPDSTVTNVKHTLSQFSEIDRAVIFGSRAKGNYKNGSDVDITLIGSNLSIELLTRISSTLDDLSIPYTLDLSIFSMIENQDLIDHINRAGKVLFEKAPATVLI